MKCFRAVVCGLVMTLAGSGASLAEGYIEATDVNDEIRAHIQALGVTQRVVSYSNHPVVGHSQQGGRINGFDIWVELNDCSGNLILHLLRDGGMRNAYTTQDCQVAGVPLF